jgi:3-hydroxyacyl-CoA dehydrogenase/enoyl-CoA hydratase/3-hydroxybutyryl-CoA epimerase
VIRTEYRDGIAVLLIDMPGRSMNVLTPELVVHLADAFDHALGDAQVKGIVIASGKNSFIAGADLAQMSAMAAGKASREQAEAQIALYGNLFRRIERAGKPVVGAASGTALGGGLELLLACHLRIVADVPSARFGLPEVTLGLLPGAGGTQRLPRLIGIAASLPLLLEGKPLDAKTAYAAGVLDVLVPADSLLEVACTAIRSGRVDPIAAWDRNGYALPGGDASTAENTALLAAAKASALRRTRGHQPAPLAILASVRDGLRAPIDDGLAIERAYFLDLIQGPVAHNMIRTLFLARQRAERLVGRPAGIERRTFKRIAVIGAGFMGAGVAQVSALAGMEVVLLDRSAELAVQSRERIQAALQADVSRGRLSQTACDQATQHLLVGSDYADLAGCEMVVEAVLEDIDVKAAVVQAAEAHLGADAIFATNTSALPIDELAVHSSAPHNLIGLHFFSPVPKMALVEVIRGRQTSEQVLAWSLDYVRQIRKTPIIVNDGYGFYTTRCVDAYYREGLRLLADGVNPELIERAGTGLGMPVGPLTLCDEIGMDVLLHIATFFDARESGAHADDRHVLVNALIARMVDAGRSGRKHGAGFFRYPAGEPKALDQDFIAGLVLQAAKQPAQEEVAARLLHAQLLETARCWAEGVIADPDEIDVGANLGWGFPSHLGGPAAAIDAIGSSRFVRLLEDMAVRHGARFTPPPTFVEVAADDFRFRH